MERGKELSSQLYITALLSGGAFQVSSALLCKRRTAWRWIGLLRGAIGAQRANCHRIDGKNNPIRLSEVVVPRLTSPKDLQIGAWMQV